MSKGNVVKLRGPEDGDFGPEIRIDAATGEILDDDLQPTGRTLEDLTDEYVPPFMLKGEQQQLSFDVGGDEQPAVIGSVLKLKAGKYPILGQYRFGSKVRVEIEVEVEGVYFKAVRSTHTG